MRAFLGSIIRLFVTGTATILPLVVTVFVVGWLVRVADAYIGPSSSFGSFLATVFGPIPYVGYVVGYLVVILLMIVLGFLVTRATVGRVHKALDSLLSSIPLLGKIYAGVGQVVALFAQNGKGSSERFGGVVHIRVGNLQMLALLTSNERYVLGDGREHLLVFVPNSPIPATGFNVLVPVDDVQRLDMSMEELAKLLMSLGLLAPSVLNRPLRPFLGRRGMDEREIL